jgi:hypothetical protein
MTTTRITHIGGPTALIEVDGWRLLTGPSTRRAAAVMRVLIWRPGVRTLDHPGPGRQAGRT